MTATLFLAIAAVLGWLLALACYLWGRECHKGMTEAHAGWKRSVDALRTLTHLSQLTYTNHAIRQVADEERVH